MACKRQGFSYSNLKLGGKIKLIRKRKDRSIVSKKLSQFTQYDLGGSTFTEKLNSAPKDYNCNAGACNTSNFQMITVGIGGEAGFELSLSGSYTDLFLGRLAFYAIAMNASDFGKTFYVEIADSQSNLSINSDIYELDLPNPISGLAPAEGAYYVDLDKVPTSVIGGGWGRANTGVAIRIYTTNTVTNQIGFSTFRWYATAEDSKCTDVTTLDCVEDFSLDVALETIKNICGNGVTVSEITPEASITVNQEFGELNKFLDGASTEYKTVTKFTETDDVTVEALTHDGRDYGVIRLKEATSDSCAPMEVLINRCDPNTGDAQTVLDKKCVGNPDQISNANEFYFMDGTYNPALTDMILVSNTFVGQPACVSYSTDVDTNVTSITDEFTNDPVTVQLALPLSNQKTAYYTLYGVVLSALNLSTSRTENGTRELSLTIGGENGKYAESYII